VFGKSWIEIIRQVLREQHDLVITGTRDLGAHGRLLFGSTGMKLLRYCPCPVWVTKPDPDWNTMARSGISGMLIGNTAERLLPQIPCSLLAVKPDDFECPIRLE